MCDLISCNIIERDTNEDVIWTWTFPSIKEKEKEVLLLKCSNLPHSYCYSRFFMKWFYIYCVDIPDTPCLPNVKELICVLWSKDFNPEKYQNLCQIMSKAYLDSGNAASLLQLYLNVITNDACLTKDNGTLSRKEHSISVPHQKTKVKELIKLFGLETILIYTAILLKKKLVVYHHSLPVLLQWIPTFTVIIGHRNVLDYLFPWLDLQNDDLEQLKVTSSYVVGFCDSGVFSRNDLFDVVVNIPAGEISVSPDVKDTFVMTKIHKDIALYMEQLADSDCSEHQLIKCLDEKTNDFISQIRSLGKYMDDGKCLVPVECLKNPNISPAINNFYFQLALAENMLLL